MTLKKIKKGTFQFTKLVLVAVLFSFAFSCSPSDGKDGVDGIDGIDANNKIVVSKWFQIKFDEISPANDEAFMLIDIENLDVFVQNGGVILMYIKETLNDEYVILPLPYDGFNYGIVNFLGKKGLMFNATTSSVSNLESTPMATLKYVMIPGDISAPNAGNYNNMSFEELSNYLGLE